jgi:cytochrome c oxidase subunit II
MEKLLGLPVLASEHGKSVDNLIIYMHLLMAALFVGWLAYFIYVLIRFRRSANPKADYTGAKTHASTYIEAAVALVEGVLLVGVAVPCWTGMVDKYPDDKEAVVIKVAAQQFAWNILYPSQKEETKGQFPKQEFKWVNASNPFGTDPEDLKAKGCYQGLNEIHVPVNRGVILHITSKDVIHSFKVIALRVTQDAIPGMMIPTQFKATQEGRYQINCAQLCGNGHSQMSAGFLVVESQEKFDQWLKEKSASGGGATSFE